MFPEIFYNGWVWGAVALAGFAFCTYLPPRIQDPKLRLFVTWGVLIPASLILIAYVYPVGIEFFRRMAVGGV